METNVVMVKLWGMPVGYLSWGKKLNVGQMGSLTFQGMATG
jgi:hypothetical protein